MAAQGCETYPILDGGRTVGEMRVYAEGLMTVFEGECVVSRGEPFRVAARSGGAEIPLGVMEPAGRGFRFKRRCSRNTLLELGVAALDGFQLTNPPNASATENNAAPPPRAEAWRAEPAPWRFFSDPALARALRGVSDACARAEDAGITAIALPLAPDKPFPLMPIFCFAALTRIGGAEYVTLRARGGEPFL